MYSSSTMAIDHCIDPNGVCPILIYPRYSGERHLALNHRNMIETWSKHEKRLESGGAINWSIDQLVSMSNWEDSCTDTVRRAQRNVGFSEVSRLDCEVSWLDILNT